jgi:hypothetical protein
MSIGIILVLAGVFTVIGAICNWDFFMNSFKSRFWVKLLGRNKARIFYGIVGTGIVILGTTFLN